MLPSSPRTLLDVPPQHARWYGQEVTAPIAVVVAKTETKTQDGMVRKRPHLLQWNARVNNTNNHRGEESNHTSLCVALFPANSFRRTRCERTTHIAGKRSNHIRVVLLFPANHFRRKHERGERGGDIAVAVFPADLFDDGMKLCTLVR